MRFCLPGVETGPGLGGGGGEHPRLDQLPVPLADLVQRLGQLADDLVLAHRGVAVVRIGDQVFGQQLVLLAPGHRLFLRAGIQPELGPVLVVELDEVAQSRQALEILEAEEFQKLGRGGIEQGPAGLVLAAQDLDQPLVQ